MRVMLTSHRFPPDDIGGVECYTQRLAAELTQMGDTVSVVTRRWQLKPLTPETLREQLPDGTNVYRFAGGGWHNLDRTFLSIILLFHEGFERLFTEVLRQEQPEVVHFNHLAGLSPRFIEIAQRHGAAVVLSLHDLYFACPMVHLRKPSGELCAGPEGGRECARTCFAREGPAAGCRWPVRYRYFRYWLSSAQRVVSYSNYVGSYFEDFGVDPARLRVIPNGVTFDQAPRTWGFQTPRQRGKLKLAYCGTVAHHKGPHVILEALRLAQLGPADLLLIGAYDDQRYVRQLREQAATISGLTFRMYGPYRRPELPALLHDTDCVIVPSMVPEAGPIVPREALALGFPVLAARLGGLPELITEGENGVTFDPNRPETLAAILKRLNWDEALLQRFREGARRSRMGTVADHAAGIRAVYDEAVADLQRNGPHAGADPAEGAALHAEMVREGFAFDPEDFEVYAAERGAALQAVGALP